MFVFYLSLPSVVLHVTFVVPLDRPVFRVSRKFSSILPSPPVCSKSGTSLQKSYFIPEPFDTFFSVSCSLISLFFSLFLARSQALELEHLSRESEERAQHGTGPKERTCCFILPLFPLLHFTTRFSRFSLVCISARVHTSRLRAYSWKTVDFYYGGGRRTACGTAGVV